ncbi:hypothetical protein A9Q98_08470 [Thalassotalea sp. 42_200_T64]|mgnify:CR=1 FL=1|nr:hypothetical protein A9Q98_08470 [Thalassotalea sp. 42_200_T64]
MKLITQCMFAIGLLAVVNAAHANNAPSGKVIYQNNCARCHGADGEPVMPRAANFQKKQGLRTSDSSLMARIKKGGRICPSYNGILRDPEIVRLITHLRTL